MKNQCKYKGFTLIEIVVAIGLLVMMLGFSGVIFKVGIESHRTAGANAEIMGKLRAITGQLNTDFKGLRKDAPLLIWFQRDYTLYDPNRYDQIMFFANGDFQSTQLYDGIIPDTPPFSPALTGIPVRGNIARIYYGQANIIVPNGVRINYDDNSSDKKYKILARRYHILTADPNLVVWPDAGMVTFVPPNNDSFEHDSISLSQWEVISNNQSFNDQVIQTCFYNRPEIDLATMNGLHMLMSQGVGSFAVQWAYWDSAYGRFLWFPSDDPDGDTDPTDSDFLAMTNPKFGTYFNMPGGIDSDLYWYNPNNPKEVMTQTGQTFRYFYPEALKFTFTLYDSRGIIKSGRTFTHIVYIGS